MQWLVLTENQEKASAFRRALPEAIVVSTKGMPFEAEIELEGPEVSYQVISKIKWSEILSKIKEVAYDTDAIILAFDPTPMGEACACALEGLLGKEKCARWAAPSLRKQDILKALWTLEAMPNLNWPKAKTGLAMSHWVQATMDIVWTARVSEALSRTKGAPIRMTRIMAALLKAIQEEETASKGFCSKQFWEVEAELLSLSDETNEYTTASIIVPTFAQLGETCPPKTRELWKQKLDEAKRQAAKGHGVPQPEPGRPWRYESLNAAKLQKHHLTKFPYFLVEQVVDYDVTKPVKPPLTTEEAQILASSQGRGSPDEVQKALLELYHQGYINHPKDTQPHLLPETVSEMLRYGRTVGWKLEREPRVFGEDNEGGEGLRPCDWHLDPENAGAWIKESPLRPLKLWLYKKIYDRARASQEKEVKWRERKVYLSGPLFLTKSQGEKISGERTVEREHALQAHMRVIMAFSCQIDPKKEKATPEEGSLFLCEYIGIKEKETSRKNSLERDNFIAAMTKSGLGRAETIKSTLEHLLALGLVTEGESLSLSPRGEEILAHMSLEFSQFIEPNYHRVIEGCLKSICRGQTSASTFLREWWGCLRILLTPQPSTTIVSQVKKSARY